MIFSYKKKVGGEIIIQKKKERERRRLLAFRQTGCLLGENENLLSCEPPGTLRGPVHTHRMVVGFLEGRVCGPRGSSGLEYLQFSWGSPMPTPTWVHNVKTSGENSLGVGHLQVPPII